jgi:predicted MFS family arabinose efflux permease
MLLGFMGIFSSLVQGGYVRRMKKSNSLVQQGILSCAIGCVIISQADSIKMLYIGCACFAFTSGTVVNGLTGLEADGHEEERGKK